MHKVIVLHLFFACIANLTAQNKEPSIQATSSKVDIRVGDDYFLKEGWILEPNKNPDIFYIGSKWLYDSKKVSFSTDIDSITFEVMPGDTYDFVITLNKNIPCHIQIVTSANPIFLNPKIAIPILVGFTIILILLYLNRNRLNTKMLLWCGCAAPVLFWVMTFISGHVHGHYNHLKNVVSELGAIGTRSELLTSSLLICLSLLEVFFSIGFYRISKVMNLSVIPAILSFAMPLTSIWAGIFTLGNEFHGVTGPLPFLTIPGSILAYLLWRKSQVPLALREISLISFFIMLFILTRFIQPFGIEYEGLVQRFFYAGWSSWTLATYHYLSKEIKSTS